MFHRDPKVFATIKLQQNFRINQGGVYLVVVPDSGLSNFVHSLCRPIRHLTVIRHRRPKRLRAFTAKDQPYRDRDQRRIAERKHETALWNRCEGCQKLGHIIDFCPRKWCGHCRSYGDHDLIDRDGIYICPFYLEKRETRFHEAEQRKLRPVVTVVTKRWARANIQGKGGKGKQAGKGKDSYRDSYAAGRQYLWDNILFLRTIEENGPQVVIIVTEIGIEIETIDAAMALSIRIDLVIDDGVLRLQHGRSRRRTTADSDVEEAEPERSESKKKKKKKKSKRSSDDEEAPADEPPSVSPPRNTTEQEASDDGDDNLENISIFVTTSLMPTWPKARRTAQAQTDPTLLHTPDPKKVLSKDYTPGLSGKFTGTRTNLEKDGDESEEEAKPVEVKAAKATPDKSAKTVLEEKASQSETDACRD